MVCVWKILTYFEINTQVEKYLAFQVVSTIAVSTISVSTIAVSKHITCIGSSIGNNISSYGFPSIVCISYKMLTRIEMIRVFGFWWNWKPGDRKKNLLPASSMVDFMWLLLTLEISIWFSWINHRVWSMRFGFCPKTEYHEL